MQENQTVWKSDNQEDKEETFIQTVRRSEDGQLGWRGPSASRWWWMVNQVRRRLVERVVPHLCADKLGGTTEADLATQVSSMGEIKPKNL